MSERFVNVDRDTPLRLPVDLRDWVPGDDTVYFVLEAVDTMALSTLRVNRRGSGSLQYPPQMMLALLIYCYSQGVMSSGKSVRYDRAGELEAQLRADIEELIEEAEQIDRNESEDPNRLPAEIARREKLREKMGEARRRLEERAREKVRAHEEREEAERDKNPGKKSRKKPPSGTMRGFTADESCGSRQFADAQKPP